MYSTPRWLGFHRCALPARGMAIENLRQLERRMRLQTLWILDQVSHCARRDQDLQFSPPPGKAQQLDRRLEQSIALENLESCVAL